MTSKMVAFVGGGGGGSGGGKDKKAKSTTGSPAFACEFCSMQSFPSAEAAAAHLTTGGHRSRQWRRRGDAQLNERGVKVENTWSLPAEAVLASLSALSPVAAVTTGGMVKDQPQKTQEEAAPKKANRFNYYLVYFKSKSAAAQMVAEHSQLSVGGARLRLRPMRAGQQRRDGAKAENKFKLKHKDVQAVLGGQTKYFSVEAEMEALSQAVKMEEEDIRARQEMVRHLANTIDRELALSGAVRIIPFGSTGSGLGFKGCDLDLLADFELSHKDMASLEKQHPDPHELLHKIQTKKVTLVSKALYKINEVGRIVTVKSCRVPIVSFVHLPTGISADVSFKNLLSVQNTQFIRFVVHGMGDERIRPLVMTLRYWAKRCQLTGSGRTTAFTNYAFVLLIFFHLQTRGALPAVKDFQTGRGAADDRHLILGWDAGFCSRPELLPTTDKTDAACELMLNFFRFYSSFDFGVNAVCPFLGKPVAKNALTERGQEPDLEPMFANVESQGLEPIRAWSGAVCVQDPFELNRNCTGNISVSTIKIFRYYCQQAADVCAAIVEPSGPDGPPRRRRPLLDLIDCMPTQETVRKKLEPTDWLGTLAAGAPMLETPVEAKFELAMAAEYYPALGTRQDGSSTEEAFFRVSESLVVTILKYCLLFEERGGEEEQDEEGHEQDEEEQEQDEKEQEKDEKEHEQNEKEHDQEEEEHEQQVDEQEEEQHDQEVEPSPLMEAIAAASLVEKDRETGVEDEKSKAENSELFGSADKDDSTATNKRSHSHVGTPSSSASSLTTASKGCRKRRRTNDDSDEKDKGPLRLAALYPTWNHRNQVKKGMRKAQGGEGKEEKKRLGPIKVLEEAREISLRIRKAIDKEKEDQAILECQVSLTRQASKKLEVLLTLTKYRKSDKGVLDSFLPQFISRIVDATLRNNQAKVADIFEYEKKN